MAERGNKKASLVTANTRQIVCRKTGWWSEVRAIGTGTSGLGMNSCTVPVSNWLVGTTWLVSIELLSCVTFCYVIS